MPQNMEDYAGSTRAIPQERVQYRSPEPNVDVLVPHIKQDGLLIFLLKRAVYTSKVFTVKLHHHRDDQAFSDNVGFLKGLDKHNMPRLGDVMVPASQIQEQIVVVLGQGSFVKFPRRKLWSGSRIQQRLLEQNMINRELRLVMERCSSSSSVPWRPARLSSWRSGTRRRTMRARGCGGRRRKGNRLTISWQFSAYEIVPGVRGRLLLARRRVLLRALCVRAPPAVARLALVTVLAASHYSEGAELIDSGSSYATFLLASLALVWGYSMIWGMIVMPAPQIMDVVEVMQLVHCVAEQIVVCQCHRSCRKCGGVRARA